MEKGGMQDRKCLAPETVPEPEILTPKRYDKQTPAFWYGRPQPLANILQTF